MVTCALAQIAQNKWSDPPVDQLCLTLECVVVVIYTYISRVKSPQNVCQGSVKECNQAHAATGTMAI